MFICQTDSVTANLACLCGVFYFCLDHRETQIFKMNKNNYSDLLHLKTRYDCFLQCFISYFFQFAYLSLEMRFLLFPIKDYSTVQWTLSLLRLLLSHIQFELFCVYLLVITL